MDYTCISRLFLWIQPWDAVIESDAFSGANAPAIRLPGHVFRVSQALRAIVSGFEWSETVTDRSGCLNKAKGGDTAAIKLLLDSVFGRIADCDAAAADGRTELEALAHRRRVA